MNKISQQARSVAKTLSLEWGNDEPINALLMAANEIDRLEREADDADDAERIHSMSPEEIRRLQEARSLQHEDQSIDGKVERRG